MEQLGAIANGSLSARDNALTFEFQEAPGQYLSTPQMFARTNDAFLGLELLALFDESGLPISSSLNLEGWDSGTEANTFAQTSYDGAAAEEPIQLHADFPGTHAVVTVLTYDALVIAPGGTFKAWTGPTSNVVTVFDGIEGITIVWHWTSSGWQSCSTRLPEGLRETFFLRSATCS